MMSRKKCSNCGTAIEKGARFCTSCGAVTKAKPRIKNVLFHIANVGLCILLIIALFITTLVSYIRFYKVISFPEAPDALNDILFVPKENIYGLIIVLLCTAAIIFLVVLLNKRRFTNIILIFADSFLMAGSLFLLIGYVSGIEIVELIISVAEMLSGAILLVIYSVLLRRRSITLDEGKIG